MHLVLHGLGTDAKIRAQLPQWLRGIDDSPQIYCLYAGERETEAEYEEFLKDQRNHLRLLLCINRLNEGVHVADIDGVILFRVTSSPILYKQQIGRALTTGNGKQPLILDIVNNFDGLSSVGTIRAEMAAAVQKLRSAGKENLVRVDKFPIEEQVEDSVRLVQELENTLNNTWDTWYAEACAYFLLMEIWRFQDGMLRKAECSLVFGYRPSGLFSTEKPEETLPMNK